MGLQSGDHLELVFDVAQEQISRGELARARAGQITQALQPPQRRQSLGTAQARVAAAVNQRQRLDDELELANARRVRA